MGLNWKMMRIRIVELDTRSVSCLVTISNTTPHYRLVKPATRTYPVVRPAGYAAVLHYKAA